MKPRARYTARLQSWAFWAPGGWQVRRVGFGFTLLDAYRDWSAQVLSGGIK